MDASKQANRKGDETKQGRDQGKAGGATHSGDKARHEGGKDAGRDRNAARSGRQDEQSARPQEPRSGRPGREGSEEE